MQIVDLEDIDPISVGDAAKRNRPLEADVAWTLFRFVIRRADYEVSALPQAAVTGRSSAAASDNVVSGHLAAFPELRMLINAGQAAWRAIHAASIQTETRPCRQF
jgi:hypothetical protein